MIADVMKAESSALVRVRDNFGRVWAWSVPDPDGQVAGGPVGRVASGVDAAQTGAVEMEQELTRLLSD